MSDSRRSRPFGDGDDQARERSISVALIAQLLSEEWDVKIAPWLRDRLDLLATVSPTTADEASAMKAAGDIFDHIDEHHPERTYSKGERLLVRVGTLLSDIGKTGPPHASEEQQELIARIFAIENVSDRDDVTLTAFFAREKALRKPWVHSWYYRIFPKQWQRHLHSLMRQLGFDPNTTTLRAIHDIHASWTYDLLSEADSGIPPRAIPAAACHHRTRGDNPRGIIADDDTYTEDFGQNTHYSRAEKLVNALDIYDACRRRSQMTHREAIDALAEEIGRRYAHDDEFREILQDIITVLNDEEETE